MSTRVVSLVIIGAGPAGLSAAAEAATLGIDTLVLDMHTQAGGHFFNLPPGELQTIQPTRENAEGKSLIDQAVHAGAEIQSDAEVWGIYPEEHFRICLNGEDLKEILARKIILAPGAIERILPFPGWTLPGVITAGGALSLLKNQKMLPGRRILISGTGPLQLSLAAQLAPFDVDVIGVLEQKSWGTLTARWRSLFYAFSQLQRSFEGLGYLLKIRSKKIPYLFGWSVIEAQGEDGVCRAKIAKVDSTGKPISSSERTIDLDCICLGYGLLPETQFTRMLECDHIMHPQLNVWVPVRDKWLQTSIPGVFSVGDAADIFGKEAAILEGKIAALGVACQLDRIKEHQARIIAAPLQKKLNSCRRFANFLNDAFNLPGDPTILATPETVICRCECTTVQQIQEAIQDGATSVQAVKYHSRAGMGWCRGITCAPLISQMIAMRRGVDLEHASQASARPPIFPVSLGDALDHEGLH